MWAILLAAACSRDLEPGAPWAVYAISYGDSTYPKAQLVEGAPDIRIRFAWSAWVIYGPDRLVLVDTGFAERDTAKQWNVTGFTPVPEILAQVGVAPTDVTDVVLTHTHWDHAGNVAPYSSATIWVQSQEWAWAQSVVSAEEPDRHGVRFRDVQAIEAAKTQEVAGDAEVAPGVFVREGGLHTPHSQWVEVQTENATIVLASDAAYLYENIEKSIATGSNSDAAANLANIERMKATGTVIPGHDYRVFERFPSFARGVVRIE